MEIFRYLRDHPHSSKKKLINHLEERTDSTISDRTFERWKAELFDIGIELEYNPAKQGYALVSDELYDGAQEFLQLAAYFAPLTNDLKKIKELRKHVQLSIGATKGHDHLMVVLDAIMSSLVIEFNHYSFQLNTHSKRAMCPYQLKEDSGRWYVVGIKPGEDHIHSFALDRITDLRITNRKFKPQANIDIDDYFDDVLGVWSGTDANTGDRVPVEQIQLQVRPYIWKWHQSLPIHHSQKLISQTDESVIFQLTIRPTIDFYSYVLKWTPYIKVLSPAHVVSTVMHELTAGLNQYY